MVSSRFAGSAAVMTLLLTEIAREKMNWALSEAQAPAARTSGPRRGLSRWIRSLSLAQMMRPTSPPPAAPPSALRDPAYRT